jgi:hypothetical protein
MLDELQDCHLTAATIMKAVVSREVGCTAPV